MSQTLFIFVSNSEFVIWILVIGYYGKAVSWWASPHCYAQSVVGGRERTPLGYARGLPSATLGTLLLVLFIIHQEPKSNQVGFSLLVGARGLEPPRV